MAEQSCQLDSRSHQQQQALPVQLPVHLLCKVLSIPRICTADSFSYWLVPWVQMLNQYLQ